MKSCSRIAIVTCFAGLLASAGPILADALGTAITYQGRLEETGSPVDGDFNMVFTLWNHATQSAPVNQIGPTLTFDGAGGNPPPVVVINGLFTVPLDFGAVYNGEERWLEITVDGITLTPRQELTSAPHARFAAFSAAPWNTNGLTINYLAGNVGIGTDIPGAKLDVRDGAVRISNTPDGKSYEMAYDAAGNYFYIDEFGAARRLAIANGGNVGIGATSPTAKLHVVDSGFPSFRLDSSSTFGSWLTLLNTSPSGDEWSLISTGSGNSEGPGKLLIRDNNNVRMTFAGANVGIGTNTPIQTLDVNGKMNVSGGVIQSGGAAITTTNDLGLYSMTSGAWIRIVANGAPIRFYNNSFLGTSTVPIADASLTISSSRKVGINADDPAAALHVVDEFPSGPTVLVSSHDTDGTSLHLNNTSVGGKQWTLTSTGSSNFPAGPGKLVVQNTSDNSSPLLTIEPTLGWVGIGTSSPQQKLDVAGWVKCQVLQITGGSDLAEPFDVREAAGAEPGMVVCIDPHEIGKLRLATTSYDRTVAGVISGANGVQPGMILEQEGKLEAGGKHAVALTGRVWVHADAEAGGPITAGDLLTTSGTPGHAMKVTDHSRANGAILGKAMSRLDSGRGLVLVLVGLQ